MIKILIKICFLSIFVSCSVKYYTSYPKYERPIDNKVFSYSRKNFKLNSSIIDTTKIYVKTCNSCPLNHNYRIECIRFFSTGQVLLYTFFGKIDTTLFANLNAGGIGYYHINKNVIRIQSFIIYAEHFKEGGGGAIIQDFGVITGDNIIMDHEHISKRYYAKRSLTESKQYKYIYQKSDIIAPKLNPNW